MTITYIIQCENKHLTYHEIDVNYNPREILVANEVVKATYPTAKAIFRVAEQVLSVKN